MIKLAFIILNYENYSDTVECVESLQSFISPAVKAIVLDNGSSDRRIDRLSSLFPEIDYIAHAHNSGFCEGNNIAVRYAQKKYNPEYFFLLNNDASVIQFDLSSMINYLTVNHTIGIMGAKIYNSSMNKFWAAGGMLNLARGWVKNRGFEQKDIGQYERIMDIDFVDGCAMIINARALHKVGLLDPVFFAYHEDADICLRMKKNGYRVVYYPRIIICHKVSKTTGGEYSVFASYYRWRNRLLIIKKHASKKQKYIFNYMLFPLIAVRDVCRFVYLRKSRCIPSLFKGYFNFIKIKGAL
ncbi:MAG: glycosyltransferase family 2 protein [bacterium]